VPNGLAELASDGSKQVVKIQTGSLALYAFVMLIGVVVLVAIYMLTRVTG
jgi:NADH-quinone oxidoreductase subunit L